ncbi:astacin-like [Topomyia yanbarensis]|uniref:astacin-like n=1 Tax=Topomyia yanbarensis TaxID=2498891 RepID=UPI00273C2D2A|nr:astacin-like [Topomyia yanbarensis]
MDKHAMQLTVDPYPVKARTVDLCPGAKEDLGERLRHYNRRVNKTFAFEQGIGYYYQFDIMLKPDVEQNAILPYDNNRWPGAIVPYVIASTFNEAERLIIEETMRHYQSLTCVQFKNRTKDDTIYLKIDNTASGCWSYVGRSPNNAYNLVNLQKSGCITSGTVAHELMHALGFYHEFTRPDRDEYITINISALAREYQTESFYNANFAKHTNEQVELYNIPYNYGSVMHYSKYAGAASLDSPVMMPRTTAAIITITTTTANKISTTTKPQCRQKPHVCGIIFYKH